MRKIMSQGYKTAAGWKNGRANAFALVKADLKNFVKIPPKKRTKKPSQLSMLAGESNASEASHRVAE